MTRIILFDDASAVTLRPLTFFRPVAEIRIGILTISEKWRILSGMAVSWLCDSYLSAKYPTLAGKDNLLINGSVLPDSVLFEKISQLKQGEALADEETIIAARLSFEQLQSFGTAEQMPLKTIQHESKYTKLTYGWDIFTHNALEIINDIGLLNLSKGLIADTNTKVIGNELYIAGEYNISCAVINTTTGPVYIGNNVTIEEGATLRGPIALCDNSVVRMGARIYGNTTLGPYCKAGGEVMDSVMFGYSNKSHEGFMGHTVLGEWCNIGAGTITSNLKNNYSEIKQWSYKEQKFVHTGLQFSGLIMGDHSKAGITTMFNSGTVVGVCCNVFGAGYQKNYIPNFTFGSPGHWKTNRMQDVMEVAELTYERRDLDFSQVEKDILAKVAEM